MVPPARSSAASLPAAAPALSLSSSAAMSATLLPATSFTLGTTRPPGVAMATPMLCCGSCRISWAPSSRRLLRMGNLPGGKGGGECWLWCHVRVCCGAVCTVVLGDGGIAPLALHGAGLQDLQVAMVLEIPMLL